MLLEMLKYMRPGGSDTDKEFCATYLEPTMGKPDGHGNYVHIIGDKPNIAFMAHHDTVHRGEGQQVVLVDDYGFAYVPESSCLGADCTTGVWLILEMIKAQVPGVYVVHADEEMGCLGSADLVKDNPDWLSHVDAAISFDRYGTDSIITHQMGRRTCSDEFAKSLMPILGGEYKPDDGGSYTDSNEYIEVVPECTNISVGYYGQHTAKETQDMDFAYRLRNILVQADWSKVVIARDPSVVEYSDDDFWRGWKRPRDWYSNYDTDPVSGDPEDHYDTLADIVADNPEEIAHLLRRYGFSTYDVLDELNLDYDRVFPGATGTHDY